MNWEDGPIADCVITELRRFHDDRGWLAEVFRDDELPGGLRPAMAYLSLTLPGVARGPHAHHEQSDLFAFIDGSMRLFLWDDRADSASYGKRMVLDVGSDRSITAVVPPGVVHGYLNIGSKPALILNCPDRLYAGEGKKEPVDEIRYEEREGHDFRMEA